MPQVLNINQLHSLNIDDDAVFIGNHIYEETVAKNIKRQKIINNKKKFKL